MQKMKEKKSDNPNIFQNRNILIPYGCIYHDLDKIFCICFKKKQHINSKGGGAFKH